MQKQALIRDAIAGMYFSKKHFYNRIACANMSMREIDNGFQRVERFVRVAIEHEKQKFCALPANRMECITFVFLFLYVFILFNVELHNTQRKRERHCNPFRYVIIYWQDRGKVGLQWFFITKSSVECF